MEVEQYQRLDDDEHSRDPRAPTAEPAPGVYRWASIRRSAGDAARAVNGGGTEPAGEAANEPTPVETEDDPARGTPAVARTGTPDAKHRVRVQSDHQNGTKRTVQSMVRFTPDEFLAIAERARVCGRPPARYIREVALGAVPKARKTAANAELIRELSAIGNTLQELRSGSRGIGDAHMTDRCELALRDLIDVIRRIG